MTDRECKVNPISSRICEKGTKSCTVYHQDRTQLCKEFHELTGGHWHEWRWDNTVKVYKCLECELTSGTPIQNPTYTNPADVLRVMMARDDWDKFADTISCGELMEPSYKCVGLEYIIEPDALLKTAVEFLEAKAAND